MAKALPYSPFTCMILLTSKIEIQKSSEALSAAISADQ